MASTFNYQTGIATFDFVLRKFGRVCERESMSPTKIGNQICDKCCWNNGCYYGNSVDYVKCSKQGAKNEAEFLDWENLKDEFRNEALYALDYMQNKIATLIATFLTQ